MENRTAHLAFTVVILIFLLYPSVSEGQETYVLVKEWEMEPVFGLQISDQRGPLGIAVDNTGNVYTTHGHTSCVTGIIPPPICFDYGRIQNFTSDGEFLGEWSWETPDNASYPGGVTYSGDPESIYVADTDNNRIVQYTWGGLFRKEWGSEGSGNGQFQYPTDVAVDDSGNVYVADAGNSRIQKFTSDGAFLTRWPVAPSIPGYSLSGIAVDGAGNVYVTNWNDIYDPSIRKFTSDGVFLKEWGPWGTGNGQVRSPGGITVDDLGNVYVADTMNNRIQKFTSDGVFLTKWNTMASADGQPSFPRDVAVDSSGNVYVTDADNNSIQKYAPVETPTDRNMIILNRGTLNGVAIDPSDPVIMVSDGAAISGTLSITVHNAHGPGAVFPVGATPTWGERTSSYWTIDSWAGTGDTHHTVTVDLVAPSDEGEYYIIMACAAQMGVADIMSCTHWKNDREVWYDGNDVVDWNDSTIQHAIDHGYVTVPWLARSDVYENWDTGATAVRISVTGKKPMSSPTGVAVDSSGDYYVADTDNHRILKFASDGDFLIKWGSYGDNNSQFNSPRDVAVDRWGNVYVVDKDNHRIQKFTSDGVFLTKWGGPLNGDNGQFYKPRSVAVDGSGNVYVADSDNHRIQKFTSNGVFLTKWGTYGNDDRQFDLPCGIAVDRSGNVYVADTRNNRIQVFTSDGVFLKKWGIGGYGESHLYRPYGIAVDRWGYVYVADTFNHRIQIFTSDGAFVELWGTQGAGRDQLDTPYGIAVDDLAVSYVYIYVADTNNNRIVKLVDDVDNTHVITAKTGEHGSISPSGEVTVTRGANQTFTITPDPCYRIENVLVDGDSVGAVKTYTFTDVSDDHTIYATFAVTKIPTITATAGDGGSISPSGAVKPDCGANQTFTITPDPCYRVESVLVDGDSVGAVTTYTFTDVGDDHTIHATFAVNTYIIRATAEAHGSISPSDTVRVNCGADQTFTITPDEGYHVVEVRVNGYSVGAVTSYTFENVVSNQSIYARFTMSKYTITAAPGDNGNIWPAAEVEVAHGASQTFNISPDKCYRVLNVLVDDESVGAVTEYTFENVTSNHIIRASFVLNDYTITATAEAHGSVSPAGAAPVNCGADQTFSIAPEENYHVLEVLVDGDPVGPVTAYTFTDVDADHTIEARFALDAYAITATAGDNGSISPAGRVMVSPEDVQTFTITPDPCYRINGVLIDGALVAGAQTYEFQNVTADHTIHANFAPNIYTITATAGDNGSVSPAGLTRVNCGDDQIFSITPDEGYRVLNVLVDGEPIGAETDYTFENVTAAHAIEAIFAQNVHVIMIVVTDSQGVLLSDVEQVSVEYGTDKTIQITPDEGYHLVDVLVDGRSVGPAPDYTFENVTEDHTVEAIVEINKYTITPSAGDNGNMAPSDQVVVEHGGSQSFSMTPDEGYYVADVLVDGNSVGAVTSYTFENVTANHSIEPVFEVKKYTIAPSAGDNGAISPSDEVLVEHGDSQSFSITPSEGYDIVDVLVDGESVGPVADYKFENVTEDHTIEPIFGMSSYTITPSPGDDGSMAPADEAVVEHGGGLTVKITPDEGYHVVDVLVDGVSVGPVTEYTFDSVMEDHTIEPIFEINIYTITASASDDGSTEPSEKAVVEHGADQKFQIRPDEDSYTVDVLVDGKSVGPVTEYTFVDVTSDHSLEPIFARKTYTITASAQEHGVILPSGAVVVEHGSEQVFEITPDEGYHVADALVDGASVGAEMTYTFENVTADHTIEAAFERTTYIIAASAGEHGKILPVGDVVVEHGADQTFEIIPDEGYHVLNVVVDGVSVGARTDYTFESVTADHSIDAEFALNVYTITASAGNNGSISPSGQVIIEHGADWEFTILANEGYHVLNISVDGTVVGAAPTYTFRDVADDHVIEVEFAKNTYVITALAGNNGSVSPSGEVIVEHGSALRCAISPEEGYRVGTALVDGESIGMVTEYTFSGVTADHTIEVTFERWDIGRVTINSNAQYTNSRSVTLGLSVSDDRGLASQMRFSNNNLTYSFWEPYASVKEWSLGAGDGRKVVYIQFMDEIGNQSTIGVSDSIILDSTPPSGNTIINNGDEYCRSADVTLTLSAADSGSGVAEMRFSNDNSTFDPPVAYSITMLWKLSGGDGLKTAYARFSDTAGNWSVVTIHDSIIMDTTPLRITDASPARDAQNVPINVSISIEFSKPIDRNSMSVSGSISGDVSGTAAYSDGTLTFAPDGNFGDREDVTVEVTASDLVGNEIEYSAGFSTGISVWPGDTNRDGTVNIMDLLPVGKYWHEEGDPRVPAETLWEAQPAIPWEKEAASHADTDGDGVVDERDLNAMDENWGRTHLAAPPAIWRGHPAGMAAESESPGIEVLRERLAALMASLEAEQRPTHSSLGQNYPNPFNPETWIPYQLSEKANVTIKIYNTAGRLIRTLDLGHKDAGVYVSQRNATYWDGRNDVGESVSSGVYFYTIKAGAFTHTRKLIVVF